MAVVMGINQGVTTRQRKRHVAQLVRDGVTKPGDLREMLASQGVVNRSTGRPFSLSTLRTDVREMQAKGEHVSEIIGRTTDVVPLWRYRLAKSVDETQIDYEFWDKLRRGKATGFQFGGLFCKPLTEIVASGVIGDGVQCSLSEDVGAPKENIEYTNKLLSRLMAREKRTLLALETDKYALGDQHIAVNPDGSFSRISPELVRLTPNDLDYRVIDAVKVTTRLDKYTIEDVFRVDGRTVTIKPNASGGRSARDRVIDYDNLIGRLPIVHFPNDRGTNEIYGRPIYEALYRLFSRYDDLIEKAIDGAELMGNPIPAFEGMDNIKETIDANATIDTEEYQDVDGNDDERTLINWDTLGVVFVGKGGAFNFKSPGAGFTNDIRGMLKALFLLLLDFTRVPEAVWGGAIASSKASAEAQMPPFYQYLESRRVQLEGAGYDDGLNAEASGGLHELVDVWLRTKALTDPRVVVGPVAFEFSELDAANWESLLKWVTYLRGIGNLDDETTLTLFGQVDNPAAVLEKAKEEADERQQREAEKQEFAARLKQAENDAANNGEEETAPAPSGDNVPMNAEPMEAT